MALDPSGERLALGAQNPRRLQVWDLETRHLVLDETYLTETTALDWSPDGQHLAFSGNQGVVTLVDSETGEIVMELPGSGASTFDLAFMPGGERLANVSYDGVTAGLGRQRRRPAGMGSARNPHRRSNGPRISPDGSQVAVTTREPDGFELLDIDTGETLASLTDIQCFPSVQSSVLTGGISGHCAAARQRRGPRFGIWLHRSSKC